MKKQKVAYLPLYVKLYDETDPSWRVPLVDHMNKLIGLIEAEGFEVVPADEVCRVKEEFERAAEKFNSDPEIVAVITQHLAYSPSLESIDALRSLKMPIIVFDTTPDYELLSADNEDRIMTNHGIHGVQEMCSMLKRYNVPFNICVGHAFHSDVISELCGYIRAAAAAKTYKNCRVGMVGGDFKGMGDFKISDERYADEIGATTIRLEKGEFEKYLAEVTEKEIEDELAYDKEHYEIVAKKQQEYIAATKTGLAVRKWVEAEKLDALTVNFANTDEYGLPKMPFVECCKTMERGKGYAGEGDTLTAGLTAALLKSYPETSFTEMFCPDWEKDVILLSHMGEMNPNIAGWKPPIIDKPFNFNSCGDTVIIAGCFKKGKAVFVNIAPMADSFTLILAEVEMTDDGRPDSAYKNAVQAWMKPCMPMSDFLKEYSVHGGTHHAVLVYNVDIKELEAFGKMMNFDVVTIK